MKKLHIIKKQGFALLLGLLTLGATSCSLDEMPYDSTSPEQVGDSDDAALSWLTGVYSQYNRMFTYGEVPCVLEFDCDYVSGPDWAFGEMGAGNFQDTKITAFWEYCYRVVHRANMAMHYVNAMQKMTPEYKTNVLGELKFLKAFSYFWLVRAYGEIPLFMKPITNGNKYNEPRQPIPTVYAEIIGLLKEAKEEMYQNTDPGFVEGHASAGAAAALLAKVYATIGSASLPEGEEVIVRGGKPFTMNGSDQLRTYPQEVSIPKEQVAGYESFDSKAYYQLAMDMADSVITGKFGNYSLLPYADLWKKGNRNKTEHIWMMNADATDTELSNQLNYMFTGQTQNGIVIEGLFYGLRDHWYKLFDLQDKRIVDGVLHRYVRIFDYTNVAAHFGSYYPQTDEWSIKATGKNMAGQVVGDGKPVAPYNDGINYVCGTSYYYMAYVNKFADVADPGAKRSDAPYPYLRLADIKLIYAEAANEVNNGPTAEAQQALKDIRLRSGANADDVVGKVKFRAAVLEERAKELAMEGDRRFDLIRWGVYVQTMNAIEGKDEVNVNKERQDRNRLFPLPTSEILSNSAINSNNPGWN